MKILITTDWYRPVINGVVTSVINLAEGLQSIGHEVRILTLSGNLHSYRDGNVTFIGSVSVGMIYPHARLRTTRGEAMIRELIEWKPDLVHSQCEFSTFYFAKQISKACGCPLVHTYHTVYEDVTHYFSPNIHFGRLLAAKFSRHILSQTDAVIVPTEKIRAMLRGYGITQPIKTIPTGLKLESYLTPISKTKRDTMRKALGLKTNDLVLTYIGRLAQEKNIDELLNLLSGTHQNEKLLLVGDGPYRSKLETQAHELEISDRVVFAGMIQPEEIADYYKLGDIFVSASQSETQGLTYIEAMAAGLPLLCRKDDCLNGVLCSGKTGFDYTNQKEFLCALYTMSSAVRFRMGAVARQTVQQNFTEAGFAQGILQVYEACLRKAAEGPAA